MRNQVANRHRLYSLCFFSLCIVNETSFVLLPVATPRPSFYFALIVLSIRLRRSLRRFSESSPRNCSNDGRLEVVDSSVTRLYLLIYLETSLSFSFFWYFSSKWFLLVSICPFSSEVQKECPSLLVSERSSTVLSSYYLSLFVIITLFTSSKNFMLSDTGFISCSFRVSVPLLYSIFNTFNSTFLISIAFDRLSLYIRCFCHFYFCLGTGVSVIGVCEIDFWQQAQLFPLIWLSATF